jgi:hypothetical protein
MANRIVRPLCRMAWSASNVREWTFPDRRPRVHKGSMSIGTSVGGIG